MTNVLNKGSKNLVPGPKIGRPNPNLFYDYNMVGAMIRYLIIGLEPGYFGEALIINDYDRAWNRAHSCLKNPLINDLKDPSLATTYDKTQNAVQNMLDFTQDLLPEDAKGSMENYRKWVNHAGLSGADKSIRTYVKLSGQADWALEEFKRTNGFVFHWETGEYDFG